jgi:hypothetical protein
MSTATRAQRSAASIGLGGFQAPNHYHLEGGEVTLDYFPDGLGPAESDGVARLIFDRQGSPPIGFAGREITTHDDPDVGLLLKVTILETIDVGNKTFSLIVPHVQMPFVIDPPDVPRLAVPIQTTGVETFHREFVARLGHDQIETYEVIALSGEARREMLPLAPGRP